MNILVMGATGYVGGRLVPRLIEAGHTVRCLVRDRSKAAARHWADRAELVQGDVLDFESLQRSCRDIDLVYYLIHSMAAGSEKFASLDRRAAGNMATAAEKAGVRQIVYLGGLGRREESQTKHLKSRHEVGDVLRSGSIPVTEFRAAVIIGSGSLSFELIHHLVNRLPMMICPRWVYTRTQPIAIRDVLAYLLAVPHTSEAMGQTIDIGGPQIITYRRMMLTVAEILGLRRFLLPVPVLTPRLSSYWVNLVTPINRSVAGSIIDSLRSETICENDLAARFFDIDPLPFEEAVRLTLRRIREWQVETDWTDASAPSSVLAADESHYRSDRRECEVAASAVDTFALVSSIGGDNGWYYANWLWSLRGFIDRQLGGVGLRRGRRHPIDLATGQTVDFWRVAEFVPGRKLVLRAEMKVWGNAWLEFEVESLADNRCRLIQTARYYPRGLMGLAYWYGVYPIHALVFRGMIKNIRKRAESAGL